MNQLLWGDSNAVLQKLDVGINAAIYLKKTIYVIFFFYESFYDI